MKTDVLKRLGLSENEIKIYLHLMRTGASLASYISKSVNIHRTHTYDILDSLIKKGVITYTIRENRKYFKASSPDKLQELHHLKEQELEQDKQQLGSLIGELTNLSTFGKSDLKISVYEGKKGFQTIFEDVLRRRKEYLILGYSPDTKQSLKKFFPGFSKKRVGLGIGRKIIVDPDLKGDWLDNQDYQEIRFFKYDFPTGIIVYDTRVILTIIQNSNQVAIVIDNDKMADNFRKLFNNIWGAASK